MSEFDEILGSVYLGGKDINDEIPRLMSDIQKGELLDLKDILYLSNLFHAEICNESGLVKDKGLVLKYASLMKRFISLIELGDYDKHLSDKQKEIDVVLSNLFQRINASELNKSTPVKDCYDVADPQYRDEVSKLMSLLFNALGSKFSLERWIELKDNKHKEDEIDISEALSLSDLLNLEKGQELVNQIKTRYKNIKGKRLKLLLLSLQKLDLLPQERMGQKFHNACKEEFNWDVSSYEAMRSYVYNEYTDNDECLKMEEFISNITKRTERK